MKKIIIPAILGAVIMVAGMLAFMPIEQASTVHTTIQNTQFTLVESFIVADFSAADAVVCDSDQDFLVIITPTAPTDADSITIDVGGVPFIYEVHDTLNAVGTMIVGTDAAQTITIDDGTDIDVEGHLALITGSGATANCVLAN